MFSGQCREFIFLSLVWKGNFFTSCWRYTTWWNRPQPAQNHLVNDVKHFKYIKLGQVKLVSHRIRQILTRTTKWRHPVSYVKSNGPNLPLSIRKHIWTVIIRKEDVFSSGREISPTQFWVSDTYRFSFCSALFRCQSRNNDCLSQKWDRMLRFVCQKKIKIRLKRIFVYSMKLLKY